MQMPKNSSSHEKPVAKKVSQKLEKSKPWYLQKVVVIPSVAAVAIAVLAAVSLASFWSQDPEEAAVDNQPVSEQNANREPVIGPACVAGEPACEEVKYLLLEATFVGGVNPWTRETLIEYLEYQYSLSFEQAAEIVDAVEYNWGEPVVASSTPTPTSSARASSPSSDSSQAGASPSLPSSTPIPSQPLPTLTEGDKTSLSFAQARAQQTVDCCFLSRANLIEYMVLQGFARDLATTAIDSLRVDWVLEARQQAQDFLRQDFFSLDRLRFYLTSQLFTSDQANAAISSLNVDWNQQAVKGAEAYLLFRPCDFYTSVAQLSDELFYEEGFTEEESDFGAISQLNLEGTGGFWKIYPNC
jgi:hypothetical protein